MAAGSDVGNAGLFEEGLYGVFEEVSSLGGGGVEDLAECAAVVALMEEMVVGHTAGSELADGVPAVAGVEFVLLAVQAWWGGVGEQLPPNQLVDGDGDDVRFSRVELTVSAFGGIDTTAADGPRSG